MSIVFNYISFSLMNNMENETKHLWDWYTNYNYRMSLRKIDKPKLVDILKKNEFIDEININKYENGIWEIII